MMPNSRCRYGVLSCSQAAKRPSGQDQRGHVRAASQHKLQRLLQIVPEELFSDVTLCA